MRGACGERWTSKTFTARLRPQGDVTKRIPGIKSSPSSNVLCLLKNELIVDGYLTEKTYCGYIAYIEMNFEC